MTIDLLKLLSTTRGEQSAEDLAQLELFLKPVGRVLSVGGYSPETNQVVFKLSLFKDNLNPSQITQLLPYVSKLAELIEPVKIHDLVKTKYKAFMVIDEDRGSQGSISLLIDDRNKAIIYRDDRFNPVFESKPMNLEDALKLIATKYFFYSKPIQKK